MAKYTSKYSGERIDNSVGTIPETNPAEDSVLVISKTGEGSYKKISEVGVTVVQATGDSETQVMSQKAVTNALGTKADKQSVEGMISDLVVQETGQATDKVMSQKIVTDSLNNKINYTDINNGLTVVDGKVNANIVKIQDVDSTELAPVDGVVTIPSAAKTTSGLVKVDSNFGIDVVPFSSTPKGTIAVASASEIDIGKRTNTYKPIASGKLNYAVKAALTDDKRIGTETTNPTTFTDTEKDRACEILGASRKLYRHLSTFNSLSYGNCKVSFISLKPDLYNSAENLSELKDVVSVEYCTIGDSGYLMGTFFINPIDGDYALMSGEKKIVISSDIPSGSFTDTVTEL